MILENYQNTKTAQEFASIIEQGCSKCSLSKHRCGPIVYRGNPKADILLLGESPGKVEWEQKKPFVGPAGRMLDEIFRVCCSMDTNKDLCLSNVSYCRPVAPKYSGKQNYTPKQEQLDKCFPFVEKFIDIIKPKVIIACGRTALIQLTNDYNISVKYWEGYWYEWMYKNNIPMFVMTHPAAILYMSNNPEKQLYKKREVKKYMQNFRDQWEEKCN